MDYRSLDAISRVLPKPVCNGCSLEGAASSSALVQTVASADASHAIAEICEGLPFLSRVNVAGPEIYSARDLAVAWKTAMNRRALLIEIPLPGKLGRALREGALTIQNPDVCGQIGFKDWLVRSKLITSGVSDEKHV